MALASPSLSAFRAIAWAQARTLRNFYGRGNAAQLIVTTLFSLGWYCLAVTAAYLSAVICAQPDQLEWLTDNGPRALFFTFVYWQIVPIMLASTGMSLDLKRLIAYPISYRVLFVIDLLLRFSTGVEVVLILAGATAGLLRNPRVPVWAPAVFVPWIVFNLGLSTGVRELISRLLTGRRSREAAMITFVLLAALPQLLLVTGIPEPVRKLLPSTAIAIWPWQIAGRIALGQAGWQAAVSLLGWMAVGLLFGFWQFKKGFRFDADEAAVAGRSASPIGRWQESVYRFPSTVFSDPMGALMEKEIRSLVRAPRFRLVFIMGFTFGLIVWLPLGRTGDTFFSENYLSVVSFYALALLGEVCFWNMFGFDRAAARLYFASPVPISRVLMAKNLVALLFIMAEVLLISLAASCLPLRVQPAKVLEALAVTGVLALFLFAIGNLVSLYYPRPLDPAQWRNAGGRQQAMLFLIYPLVSVPVALAYLARFAFESDLAFYGVIVAGAALGAIVYAISLESAVQLASERRERFVEALSSREGPISTA